MTQPRIPVPAALADVLALAGLRGSVVIEQLDGRPPTAEQEQLARGLVQHHGQPMSDAAIAAKAKAYLQRQGAAAATPPAKASGKVGARRTASSKPVSTKPRKAGKPATRKAARRPAKG